MSHNLEILLARYEAGALSRRDLLGTLAALMLPVSRPMTQAPGIGLVKQLNHVTLRVPDVERAHAFYRDLFGMPVLTPQPPGVNLRAGTSFVGLYPVEAGGKPGIDHFCLGLERFDAEDYRRKLVARGLDAGINQRGNTKELYFTDPDGLTVQLQDARYRGGVGPLGDQDPG